MATTLSARPGPDARRNPDLVDRADWRSPLARAGLVAKGAFHLVLAFIVAEVVLGSPSEADQASSQGAVERVAQQPYGSWLLGLLAAGLAAYAVWRLVQAATGDPVEGDDATTRVKQAGKGVIYLGLAATSAAVLLANRGTSSGGSSGGSDTSSEKAATVLFDLPGGQLLVIAIGLATVAIAGHAFYRHVVRGEFLERLDIEHSEARRPIEVAGRWGYLGKTSVYLTAGTLFAYAGLTHDPDDAKSMSTVVADLADVGWGVAVLWAAAAGLALYGLFAFAEARYRRAT